MIGGKRTMTLMIHVWATRLEENSFLQMEILVRISRLIKLKMRASRMGKAIPITQTIKDMASLVRSPQIKRQVVPATILVTKEMTVAEIVTAEMVTAEMTIGLDAGTEGRVGTRVRLQAEN